VLQWRLLWFGFDAPGDLRLTEELFVNGPVVAIGALEALILSAGGWLGWQLLRQNGRLLLRLEELEKRLNELEFGGADEPEGLPTGSEAPPFELPDLAGESGSLAQFRGQPVLLIFFNPDCGFCRDLAPKLAEVAAGFQPAVEGGILPPGINPAPIEPHESFKDAPLTNTHSAGLEARLNGRQGCLPPRLLILSTGDVEKNRQLFAEHKLAAPVLLQNDGEVAKVYQAHGTPSGYLISPEGKIASKLAMGADALLALASGPFSSRGNEAQSSFSQPSTLNSQPTLNGNGDGRVSRFGNRSLAKSKLKRDGLKAGTPAPDFRLPRLDGRGDFSLAELRGRRVLLVFSSPHCGPCEALAPELEKLHREQMQREVGRVAPRAPQSDGNYQNGARGVTCPALNDSSIAVVMISKGEPKENRAKVKEHGLTFPVALQQQWEISRRYAMFATPVAYLINEQGVIVHDVAVGTDAILDLMARAERMVEYAEAVAAT
jgi:peroxiredoxin